MSQISSIFSSAYESLTGAFSRIIDPIVSIAYDSVDSSSSRFYVLTIVGSTTAAICGSYYYRNEHETLSQVTHQLGKNLLAGLSFITFARFAHNYSMGRENPLLTFLKESAVIFSVVPIFKILAKKTMMSHPLIGLESSHKPQKSQGKELIRSWDY